ncbi:NUDIX domain-containing protein [Erysipelothrix aquatica]|uniref:NUDIX domain-containing protein n=1 Tax=Erysipelothrix aquatica TaxID=2683714 RepID=UPI00135809C5|nr:NUDIX domain-containing protein [Erysipelothrix aquatica]
METTILGRTVNVKVHRPMGSMHPVYSSLLYELNYGEVEGVYTHNNELQDAYLVGVEGPVSEFTGQVIAVIHRENSPITKWVVAQEGAIFYHDDILRQVNFQEQYFNITIDALYKVSAGFLVYREQLEREYLLIRLQDQENWSLPKGRIKRDELSWDTANRELYEEVGLSVDSVETTHFVLEYDYRDQYHKKIILYLGSIDTEQEVIKHPKIETYAWMSYDKAYQAVAGTYWESIIVSAEQWLNPIPLQ